MAISCGLSVSAVLRVVYASYRDVPGGSSAAHGAAAGDLYAHRQVIHVGLNSTRCAPNVAVCAAPWLVKSYAQLQANQSISNCFCVRCMH